MFNLIIVLHIHLFMDIWVSCLILMRVDLKGCPLCLIHMLISFFLNEMILRQFYFVYSDLSSISADLVVSPHSAHKPWTFAHDSRSISHSYTPVPTSTVRLDRRHFLIRHWFRHHLIRSSSLTCFGVLRPHDLRHCLIWVRPLILLPHSSSHLYRIGLRHRLIRSWSSSPTTCSHSPYRVIFTARVISSSPTSISSLSSSLWIFPVSISRTSQRPFYESTPAIDTL